VRLCCKYSTDSWFVLINYVSWWSDRDALGAVLHVHPVVATVPDTLNAQIALGVQRLRQSSQWLYEETLGNFTLPCQYQYPRVNSETVQAVLLRLFQLLDTFIASLLFAVDGFSH